MDVKIFSTCAPTILDFQFLTSYSLSPLSTDAVIVVDKNPSYNGRSFSAPVSLSIDSFLPQSNISSHKIISRPLTSATSRSSPPPATRPPSLPSSSNTIPDLCLGAGGKAPGFVQQMLFSSCSGKEYKRFENL